MNPFTLIAWFLIAAMAAAVVPYIIGKRALARKVRERADNRWSPAPYYVPSFGKRRVPVGALGPVGHACPGAVGTLGGAPGPTGPSSDPLSDPESFMGSSDYESRASDADLVPGSGIDADMAASARPRPVEPATAGDGYHFVDDHALNPTMPDADR